MTCLSEWPDQETDATKRDDHGWPVGMPCWMKGVLFRFVFCFFDNAASRGVHERLRGDVLVQLYVFLHDLPAHPCADIAGRGIGHSKGFGSFPDVVLYDVGIHGIEVGVLQE